MAGKITELTAVSSPDNADLLETVQDVATTPVSKKVTWTTVKAFLKTYFDTLYGATGFPAGFLYGLTLSNNGSDGTNDIDIATGKATDATNAVDMVLASALTKRTDAAWAVGTGNGGLDTGAVGNNTYHVWLIKRSDTGVVDALFSLSASAPTMPASYDYKRRIGSIVRTGGAIKAFIQDGDKFMWSVPAPDVAAVNPGTAAVTRTLTVPTGVRVEALLSAGAFAAAAADVPQAIYLSDLSITDSTATATGAWSVEMYYNVASAGLFGGFYPVFTNTSAQIRSRLQASASGTTFYITTHGWTDTRGRVAP